MSNVEQIVPSELDLHAYLDDELAPDQRAWVIQWLMDHPEKAHELIKIQLREDLLRTAIRQSVSGDTPDTLRKHIPHRRMRSLSLSDNSQTIWGFAGGVTTTLIIISLISMFSGSSG